MKKKELIEMGIEPELAKKIEKMHYKELGELRQKLRAGTDSDEKEEIRNAIRNMLPMLIEKYNLEKLLLDLTYYYHQEMKKKKEDRKMAYYNVCEKCGARLDPGEKCDCEERTKSEARENEAESNQREEEQE